MFVVNRPVLTFPRFKTEIPSRDVHLSDHANEKPSQRNGGACFVLQRTAMGDGQQRL
jgi:hypothetical protein